MKRNRYINQRKPYPCLATSMGGDKIRKTSFKPISPTGPHSTVVLSPTADPGIQSSIPTWYHTFVEIQINNFYGHSPPADSRGVIVSYKGKYKHEVLVNNLVKLAQEKSVVR